MRDHRQFAQQPLPGASHWDSGQNFSCLENSKIITKSMGPSTLVEDNLSK